MERPAARAANENRAMSEPGDGDDVRARRSSRRGGTRFGEEPPPAPREPFDPSTREFPAVGRRDAAAEDREAEEIERRHEVVSMDTSSFWELPAPTPATPFVPPD